MDLNITTDDNQSGVNEYYYEYYYEYELLPGAKESFYVALGLQWMNTILILSLNTAVIVTILRYKKKSRLYFLLLHMAIADLTTGIIDAFVNALERSIGVPYLSYWWFAGDFFCRLQRTLSSISLGASNFILAATSVDRAFVVVKPMLSIKRGYTLQKILIGTCWILSTALSSPLFTVHSKVSLDPLYLEDKQDVPLCIIDLDGEEWKMLFYVMLVFYALIPLTIVTVSYTILIFAIYKRARTPPNSFIGAWTPYMVMLYLNIFEGFNDPIVMPFVTTYYWNCSVNPIIFFVFHKRKPARTTRAPYTTSVFSSDTLTSRVANSGNSVSCKPDRMMASACAEHLMGYKTHS